MARARRAARDGRSRRRSPRWERRLSLAPSRTDFPAVCWEFASSGRCYRCDPAAARAEPSSHGPRPHPQLLDHRPHRPWEINPGRPHPRGHRHGHRPRHARAGARLDGAGARARDHDQGAGRPRGLEGPPAEPDRHAGPRRFHLRGLALAPGLRRRAARRRRGAGHRGADRRKCLPGDREQPGDRSRREQDRPAAGRPRRCGRRGRGARGGRPRPGAQDLGEDRRGHRGGARRDRRADPSAGRRSRGAAACARVRLVVRPVPRGGRLRPHGGRLVQSWRARAGDGAGNSLRSRGGRLLLADHGRRGCSPRRRGRLRDHRTEGRQQAARRRHAHLGAPTRRRAGARLQGRQADGLRRPLSDRLRRLPRAPRRTRATEAERRRALLRAGDFAGARLRLPLRLPRPPAHGDRARAARARVRSRSAGHGAERRLSRRDEGGRRGRGAQPIRHAERDRARRRAVHQGVDHRAQGLRRAR